MKINDRTYDEQGTNHIHLNDRPYAEAGVISNRTNLNDRHYAEVGVITNRISISDLPPGQNKLTTDIMYRLFRWRKVILGQLPVITPATA